MGTVKQNVFVQQLGRLQKKVTGYFTLRRVTVLAGIAVVLSFIPLVVLAFYAFPQIDDFSYGVLTHNAWVQSGSLGEVFKQAAAHSAGFYNEWQGSFVACFLMALQPAVFGGQFYAITPVIMLLSLCGGILLFCRAVFIRILKVKADYAWLVSFLLMLVAVQLVPSAAQGFYWFNGALFYTFFFGLSLMLYACCIGGLTAKSKAGIIAATVCSCLLGFIIGGGNYITGPASVVVLCFLAAVWLMRKNKRGFLLVLPLLFTVVSLIISLLSPGNQVRQQAYAGQMQPFLKSILYSFYNAAIFVNSWLSIPFMLFMLLLVPVFWKVAGEIKFSFRYPAVVLFFSYCFLSALFFPHIRSLGTAGPPRLYNILYFAFVLLFSGNFFYWLGWARKKTAGYKKGDKPFAAGVSSLFKRCAVGVLLFFFAGSAVFALSNRELYSSIFAIHTLRTGQAAAYKEQRQNWSNLLESPQEEVLLPPLTVQPAMLVINDDFLSEDGEYWLNKAVADYYGKTSVRLLAENNTE